MDNCFVSKCIVHFNSHFYSPFYFILSNKLLSIIASSQNKFGAGGLCFVKFDGKEACPWGEGVLEEVGEMQQQVLSGRDEVHPDDVGCKTA